MGRAARHLAHHRAESRGVRAWIDAQSSIENTSPGRQFLVRATPTALAAVLAGATETIDADLLDAEASASAGETQDFVCSCCHLHLGANAASYHRPVRPLQLAAALGVVG